MNKNRTFKEKGITLIALVVTIVVLLILAGIAIMALTGENGILARAAEANLINEKAKVEELIKMSYMSKKIDALGETPLKETVISEIIKDLRENGYAGEEDIKTITNAGSTYSGLEIKDEELEVIDATGSEISTITLKQGDSKKITVSIKMTEGESKVYVKIQGKYYEIIYTDTEIGLAQEGQASVVGEEYYLTISPATTGSAILSLVNEQITEEQPLVNGAEVRITATQTMGDANFTIKVKNADGTDKATKTGKVTVVLNPIHPDSITITSAGNVTQLQRGSYLQLTATTSPSPITDTIYWSSSNTSRATVSSTGRVYGVSTGSVTITATAKDGSNVEHGSRTFNLTIIPRTVSITVQSEDTSKGTVANTINGTHSYNEGTNITLSATPASGYELDGWYIGSEKLATNSYTVPTNGTAKTIVAKFNAVVTSGGSYSPGDTINKTDSEDFVGYYADIDDNGTIDGVIYADLVVGNTGDGELGTNGRGGYNIPKSTDTSTIKDYKISTWTYTGQTTAGVYKANDGFGTKQVLVPVSNSTGTADRFYIMQLSDFTKNSKNKFYWYFNAANLDDDFNGYGTLDRPVSGATNDFGKGKENTIQMLDDWNNKTSTYGKHEAEDLWGVLQDGQYSLVQTTSDSKKWFVPSKSEWAAFAEELGITKDNKNSFGLNNFYWSSSQRNSYSAYRALFLNSGVFMGDDDAFGGEYVRLGATF